MALADGVRENENVEKILERTTEENVEERNKKNSPRSHKRPHTMQSPSICETCSEANSEIVIRPHPGRLAQMLMAPSTPRSPRGYLRKTQSSNDLQKYKTGNSPKYKRDNNMVLQLVVPVSSSRNSGYDNYMTTNSMDDISDTNSVKDRCGVMRPLSVNDRRGGYPSPELNGHINHGFRDLPPRSPLMFTTTSTPTHGHELGDDPTPQDKKKRAFADVLIKTLSLFYALFIITFGLAFYVSDVVDGGRSGSEIFSLLVVSLAFIYLLYLTIDINLYSRKKQRLEKLLEKQMQNNFEVKETPEGDFQFDVVLPKSLKKSMKHDYCFNKDRHSTNFFLKLGAIGFCFGHLIHSFILLGYQVMVLNTTHNRFYECSSTINLIIDIVYPLYSFLLLYFIFKYSNVIINRNRTLARFGIIHCLSASICFWIWTIFREILEAIASKQQSGNYPDDDVDIDAAESPVEPFNNYSEIVTNTISITPRRFTVVCGYEEAIETIWRDVSPYLYPFSVEFSILVVGIWFLIWQNIGICQAENEEEAATTECNNPSLDDDVAESNITVHVDCHSSNKGLFAGFVVLVLTLVNCILYFIAVYASGKVGNGTLTHIIFTLCVISVMVISCGVGYKQIIKLDLNSAHHNMLDDFLLFICIPAYFLNGIFSIIPYIVYGDAVKAVLIVLEICQVLLQTVFIIDGVRRSSNTKKLRKTKPGREMVTFLIFTNIALWLLQTFEVKSAEVSDDRYDFYGKELWTILGHVCLPLMMFYRFHSAVCFGDIWKYAYEPSGH